MDQPQEKQPGTAVAKKATDSFLPLAALPNIEEMRHRLQTNYDMRGPKAAEFITQMMATDNLSLRDLEKQVLPVKYYVAHVAEVVTQSGEVITVPRVILIAPDGRCLAFVSEGATQSMDLIRSLCGDGPWDPPLQISVVPRKTRHGFYTYRLCLGLIGGSIDQESIPSDGDKQKGKAGK